MVTGFAQPQVLIVTCRSLVSPPRSLPAVWLGTGRDRCGDRARTALFLELSWNLGGFSFSQYLAAALRCSCTSYFKSLLRRSMGPW